jgi:hypothetical protein
MLSKIAVDGQKIVVESSWLHRSFCPIAVVLSSICEFPAPGDVLQVGLDASRWLTLHNKCEPIQQNRTLVAQQWQGIDSLSRKLACTDDMLLYTKSISAIMSGILTRFLTLFRDPQTTSHSGGAYATPYVALVNTFQWLTLVKKGTCHSRNIVLLSLVPGFIRASQKSTFLNS